MRRRTRRHTRPDATASKRAYDRLCSRKPEARRKLRLPGHKHELPHDGSGRQQHGEIVGAGPQTAPNKLSDAKTYKLPLIGFPCATPAATCEKNQS